MKTLNKLLCLCVLSLVGNAFANGNKISVDTANQAGATSNSSMVVEGAKPTSAIGLPVTQSATPSPLLGQVPAPPYVLFLKLMEETGKFGDMEISGKEDVAQWTLQGKIADVTVTSTPYFLKYRKPTPEHTAGRDFTTKFISRFKGNANWLGTVMFTSHNGELILPPADRGLVWEALEQVSHQSLKRVLVAPVPNGYGVNVGVRTEGSNLGVSSAFGKLLSVFIGLGPSYSVQDGTTMPTGTWSQQYIVLEENENGIPLEINLVDQKKAEAEQSPAPDRVQVAREVAVKQAQALAEATEKIRQSMVLTLNVPTNEVVREQKSCKVQELTLESGEKVKACIGPTNGSYGVTRVVPRTATGQLSVLTEH